MLQTLNETERRKITRNFKLKNSADSHNYQAMSSPYTVNQSGFSTMNNGLTKNFEVAPDNLIMSVEEGKVSQKYLRTKKIKKSRRSKSPLMSTQSPKNY